MIDRLKDIDGVYIAESADVIGNVEIGEDSTVFYNAVIRGDAGTIIIGKGTNIQDGCVLHTDSQFVLRLGDYVTVGHNAIVHGCEIGDNTLVGMGSIIMNGAKIGRDCIVAAGALVTGGTVVPDGHLIMGNPAKVKRPITDEEKEINKKSAYHYIEKGKMHFGVDK